jgi:DNA-binding XRE family transcriptional regulator
MANTDAASLARLKRAVIQRRVQLGWHKADAATAADLTITTYMRVEKGLSVRDVTYAKIERAFGWAPGACVAILEGATEAQLAGDIVDGVRYAPVMDDDGASRAVQDAVMATAPEMTAGKMAELSKAVVAELRKRGIVSDEKSSR